MLSRTFSRAKSLEQVILPARLLLDRALYVRLRARDADWLWSYWSLLARDVHGFVGSRMALVVHVRRSRARRADGIRRRLAGALPRAPDGAVLHARPLQVPHEEAQARLARPPSTGPQEKTTTPPPRLSFPIRVTSIGLLLWRLSEPCGGASHPARELFLAARRAAVQIAGSGQVARAAALSNQSQRGCTSPSEPARLNAGCLELDCTRRPHS